MLFVTPLADVEISVDDVSVGKTPFDGPVVVSAGRRKIVASKAGRPSLTKLIDVAGGDTLSVPLTLAETDATPAPALSTAPDDITGARGKTKALALTTDVLIGAAGVMGGGSIYLTVATRGSPSSTIKQGQNPVVRFGATPGGVRVLGTF